MSVRRHELWHSFNTGFRLGLSCWAKMYVFCVFVLQIESSNCCS